MALFPFFLRRFRKVVKIGFVRSFLVVAIILAYAVFSEYLLQHNNPSSGIHTLFESLWWTMQTVTTIGYGDTPVVGFFGRLNAIFIMVAGIGSIGFVLANLGVDIVDLHMARKLGQARTRMKKHVVICNYNDQAVEIAQDILSEGHPVLLLGTSRPKLEDSNVDFVSGSSLVSEDLVKAGIDKCDVAVILPDRKNESEDPAAIDAKTLVSSMSIRKKNPDVYIIAELLQRSSETHAQELGVDEVVIRGNISSMLISNAVLNPGISKLVSELFAPNGKIRFSEISIGPEFMGKSFQEFKSSIEKSGNIVVALRKGDELIVNPERSQHIDASHAIILSPNKEKTSNYR